MSVKSDSRTPLTMADKLTITFPHRHPTMPYSTTDVANVNNKTANINMICHRSNLYTWRASSPISKFTDSLISNRSFFNPSKTCKYWASTTTIYQINYCRQEIAVIIALFTRLTDRLGGKETTRPDTRPIPVADGWAEAELRVFPLFDSSVTDRPTDWRTKPLIESLVHD